MNDRQVNDLLSQVKSKYKDQAKREIMGALSCFKELIPRIEKHVSPNGEVKDMLTLYGTIPISFRNNTYNIPVQFYFTDTFPYKAPICYVRPTSEMSVNPSNTVDSSGLITVPYLNDWKYPTSEFYVLINVLIMRFNEQTPLFARPKQQTVPYPQYNSRPQQQQQQQQLQQSSLPYPTQQSSYPRQLVASSLPYPTQQSAYGGAYLPYPSMPTPSNIATAQIKPPVPPAPIYHAPATREDTIKPEHYLMSLRSAVEEKAFKLARELEDQTKAEIDSLDRLNHELRVGQQRIDSMTREAENEINTIKKYTGELRDKCAQLNENLGRIKHRDNTSIDDAVVIPAPLYRQITNLYAEELALQDVIYNLNVGLTNKTITLDSYLRQVRLFSNKQFMVRALLQRCREVAGLFV
jgi:ESCRT-I complex subunit TSG101